MKKRQGADKENITSSSKIVFTKFIEILW